MTTLFMDIRAKVALITGSAKRLGRATAIELARKGARVAVHYRSSKEDALDTLRLVREAGSDGDIFHAELTKPADVHTMFDKLAERFGHLDILVNNASLFLYSSVENTTPEQWDE